MPDEQRRDTELILAPGTFAFVLDETKGNVNVLTGPLKSSLSTTDKLVTYDATTKRFIPTSLQQAIQTNITIPKGSYVILENPTKDAKQPDSGKSEALSAGTLRMGQIENMPGPASFALWPGQCARVVKGHHLRSNQYLLVRVYDDEAAKNNWDKSIVRKVTTEDTALDIKADSLLNGQLLVIRGTEVAFYIPPTGIEVLEEAGEHTGGSNVNKSTGKFVRDAVTLERLEYAILLDEDGNKAYMKGPDVVFPKPTQQFITVQGNRKFRAFELQPTTGVHVKVISDYTDEETGTEYKAGEEIFITGKEQAIYYPRPEHNMINYGEQGRSKYFATAIPAGEGRYVLNRLTGNIGLVRGPNMFLPNPIEEVMVKRILSDRQCELFYPGNIEALQVNQALREQSQSQEHDSTTRYSNSVVSQSTGEMLEPQSLTTTANITYRQGFVSGDQIKRKTSFTPPRTVTLNTKYEGAVRVNVFSGYAIQKVDSHGKRETIVGPKTVLLEYDEELEVISLSKGKPKNSDKRMDTVYLKHKANPVSDILSLKTNDLVDVDVHVKYLVEFDDDKQDRWFSVDNYVQYMVDHLRSLIANTVRRIGVQEFYQSATDIMRDIVLGVKEEGKNRPLKHFEENGMTVYDLEVIKVTIQDNKIDNLLSESRQQVLSDAIELERQTQLMTLTEGKENATREIARELEKTQKLKAELDAAADKRRAQRELDNAKAKAILDMEQKQANQEAMKVALATEEMQRNALRENKELDKVYAEFALDRQVRLLNEEADASKTRLTAVQPAFIEALIAASNTQVLEKVTPQMAALAFVNGHELEDTISTMLKGTSAEGILANLKKLSANKSLTKNGAQ